MPSNRSVVVEGNGKVGLLDLPLPEVSPRMALVRVVAGAVSSGTETGMIRELRERPREMNEPWRAGYSAAGFVEAVGDGYAGPAPGSPVAVYGAPYVSHSDYLAVPQNLVAATSLPPEEAAFGGIAAIAMHGVRLGRIGLGERVGVLGLGVLGQMVAQMARACGAFVLASDPVASRREMALSLGADVVTSPEEWDEAVAAFTKGEGLDVALVVAGTPSSNAPAVQGLRSVRYHGRVVIVGNVRTEFDREDLFRREATVVVSRAGGPGRYDPGYERESHPWPAVRWTEGANLQSSIELMEAGRVRTAPLISDVLPVERAPDAYDRLMTAADHTLAIVLKFGDRPT
jgi:threonine dehydrogenase-like Zn-dependent dehydrogenase